MRMQGPQASSLMHHLTEWWSELATVECHYLVIAVVMVTVYMPNHKPISFSAVTSVSINMVLLSIYKINHCLKQAYKLQNKRYRHY